MGRDRSLEHLASRFENLDELRMRALPHADKNCRKLHMGATPWSPIYQANCARIEYWTLVRNKLSGRKQVNANLLRRKAKAANITYDPSWTLEDVKAMLKSAYQEKKRNHPHASDNRFSHLDSLATAKAIMGKTDATKEKNAMIRRETQRKEARLIRRVNDKLRSSSLSLVIAPDADGNWTEMTAKDDIERACLEENERRFNQASNTPFLQPPLFDEVGPLGTGPAVPEILRGEYVPPTGTDPYAVKLLPHLRRNPEVQEAEPIGVDLDVPAHCHAWHKAKEATSSCPTGVHAGHCKAGAAHEGIATMEAQMANIPYRTGYSPRRWQHGINAMLLKKPNNFFVNKLRAILLYDVEFNQGNKKIGRDMMYYTEDLQQIADEQYGSRKGHSAINQSLNKKLSFDLLRLKKKPGAHCANDAKGCYDRIVHSVASISMQRQNVPLGPIVCMFTTIQNLKHYIRTIYGDSELCFSGELYVIPIQGVGQGNGAGPQIWAVVSTPILEMMRAEGHLCYFRAAISGDDISFVGFAFVDDVDLLVTSPIPEAEFTEIAERMQRSVTDWEGGLRATGGAIDPAKTHWYLIAFVWHMGNWRYASIDETPASIQVRDASGTLQTLERLAPHVARRTLGVRLAPDGNSQAEFRHLRGLARSWAEKLRTGHLPRHLAWQNFTTTICRSLFYPLPATTLTKSQCEAILAPALTACLPASGIFRHLPREVVHGPIKYQGLGIPDLYLTQELGHIHALLTFATQPNDPTRQTSSGMHRAGGA